MGRLSTLKNELNLLADPKQAAILQRFFKTGKGQYGHGDIFLGIKVPILRGAAKKYAGLTFVDLQSLLNSKIHEYRMAALLVLTKQFEIADSRKRKQIYAFYLKNYRNINNWDLVDLSAPAIVGQYLLDKPRKILLDLAGSDNLWKKRIAIVCTYAFIRQNQFKDTLRIAVILLNDKHDLIHKACGWMLREVGKRQEKELTDFLEKYRDLMPRTMLRYAIEKLPEPKRLKYLVG